MRISHQIVLYNLTLDNKYAPFENLFFAYDENCLISQINLIEIWLELESVIIKINKGC